MTKLLYLESRNKGGKVGSALEKINHLERQVTELRFKEINGGWLSERECA